MMRPPTVAIDASCRPPALNFDSIQCDGGVAPRGGGGNRVDRIIDVSFFFYEVDTLEMRLWELDDVVDQFVIIVATYTHHGMPHTPILPSLMENDSRFAKFVPKVKIMIHNHTELQKFTTINWGLEKEKQDWGVEIAKTYSPTDLIIFGHVDEIPARNTIAMIRHCNVPLPLNIGIWFPMGTVDEAFRTDWPAHGHPYTLGDPFVGRPQQVHGLPVGKEPHVALGGMHVSNDCYPPYVVRDILRFNFI